LEVVVLVLSVYCVGDEFFGDLIEMVLFTVVMECGFVVGDLCCWYYCVYEILFLFECKCMIVVYEDGFGWCVVSKGGFEIVVEFVVVVLFELFEMVDVWVVEGLRVLVVVICEFGEFEDFMLDEIEYDFCLFGVIVMYDFLCFLVEFVVVVVCMVGIRVQMVMGDYFVIVCTIGYVFGLVDYEILVCAILVDKFVLVEEF